MYEVTFASYGHDHTESFATLEAAELYYKQFCKDNGAEGGLRLVKPVENATQQFPGKVSTGTFVVSYKVRGYYGNHRDSYDYYEDAKRAFNTLLASGRCEQLRLDLILRSDWLNC